MPRAIFEVTRNAPGPTGTATVAQHATATVQPLNNDGDYVDPSSNVLPGPLSVYPDEGGGLRSGGMYGNTGVLGTGRSLTTISGDYTISTSGTTLMDKHITGRLTVNTSNVTVKYCQIDGGVTSTSATNLRMWYCNVGNRTGRPARAMNLKNTTLRRCNIMGFTDGWASSTGNIDIQDCFVHDLWETHDDYFGSTPYLNTHSDTSQISGSSNYTFSHNRMYCWIFSDGVHALAGDQYANLSTVNWQTGNLSFYALQNISSIVIHDNIMRGKSYDYITVTSQTSAKPGTVSNMTITDNKWGSECRDPMSATANGLSKVVNLTYSGNAAWNGQ